MCFLFLRILCSYLKEVDLVFAQISWYIKFLSHFVWHFINHIKSLVIIISSVTNFLNIFIKLLHSIISFEFFFLYFHSLVYGMHNPTFYNFIIFIIMELAFQKLAYIVFVEQGVSSLE